MRVVYLQHVEFENPGKIIDWANEKEYEIKGIKLFKNDEFPSLDTFDMLLIMGGPMGIYDEEKFKFLKEEKIFIKNCIKMNKKVIGICLGAQLIADVLGSRIYKNRYKEIGWFPISCEYSHLREFFNEKEDVFHWHGDTFDLPKDSTLLFSSKACKNQGFLISNNILGLQFHFEMKSENIVKIIKNCKDDIEDGKYIQSEKEILNNDTFFERNHYLLYRLLDHFIKLG